MSRIESIRELLASSPDDTFLLYSLGMELLGGDHPAEAAEQFRRVIQLDPDYLAAYAQLGLALQATGDNAAAAEVFAQGVEVADRQGNGHAADRLRLLLSAAEGGSSVD